MKDYTPLDRHEYIFQKILRNELIQTTDVAQYLGTTRKTIERDLKDWISPLFERQISYIKGVWVIPEPIIDIKFYTPNELSAISYIFKYMNKDNPKLYSKTINLFNELHEKVSHSIYKQSSIEDILSTHKNEFFIIKNAIEDTKEIKFKFYGHDKQVQPLKIANLEKYWYLLCYDLHENRFSKYHLKGIQDIEILNIMFDVSTHHYLEKLDDAINAFFNIDTVIDVELEIDWDAKKVLSRKKLNQTQEIIKNDELFILKIKVTHFMEIIPTIQQWIPHIKVISPKELKEQIEENIKKYNI